ncbi:single-stranded DNA binding protein [Cyanophage P-RSM6]|uniref:single strand DNA binding protein n=1 Tax=Cyanophage P-RSM6 TaxID=929832 RepID=UPI0002C184E2|nr:single strand DNA binding protein [Cyanophage P-RSM6]AGH57017.1 single-stranded DNA binding protein [Cyanophage P-RSM6]|tara:strand:+ start:2628 stop:3533 length:906 start_codon:yes stop_codon:yes gene_type:complete
MSFASLKKSSGSVAKLTKELEKLSSKGGGNGPDDRLWKPEVDKAGNGYAVIRFLPAPTGEELPWAQVWSHAFQGPGGWYIENSLTTLGQNDPVGELNRVLWNSGIDSDKDVARKQKRKLSYFSNILVVKDPLHPENEGRVFLYKYGKKIHDKLVEAMKPQFEDEEPINPFDFWKGADFKLKIVKQDGYWNYDRSEFASPSTLGDYEDSKLEEIYNQEYSLVEFTSPKNFKSYEDLEKRLNLVLGKGKARVQSRVEEEELELPVTVAEETPTPSKGFGSAVESLKTDEDPDLAYFSRLAEED